MEHAPASNEHLEYQRAAFAVQQATGMTPDQFVKMYRSQSSQQSSTPKSLKRKSKHSRDPRSVSMSMPVFTPTESPSNSEISRGTVEMSRQYGISVESAPAAVPLSRGPSSNSFHARSPSMGQWPNDVTSAGINTRGQPTHINGVWQEPSEYIAKGPNFSVQPQPNYVTSNGPEQQTCDPDLLYATSPQFAWSTSSFNSPRLSVDYTDASSVSPFDMSRDPTRGSLASNLTDPQLVTDHLAMMPVKSEVSHISCSDSQSRLHYPAPYHLPEHSFVPDRSHVSSSATYINAHHTSLESPSEAFEFTTSPNESQSSQFYAAFDMHRSPSNESSASNTSYQSRMKRRHLETLQQSQRSLAPALSSHSSSSSSSSTTLTKKKEHSHHSLQGEKMVRVTSENGEEKMYGVLPRNTDRPKRPTLQKLLCPNCNDHPEGFRGEHELQRHVSRAHAKIRKVWVCVDSSPDQKFLANCKACRTKKRYGAYYNAAAHLRRTHFNPRKRGRRSKGEEYEKRGGKGGGCWPPMNELKENWMREVEEMVTDDAPELAEDEEGDVDEDVELDQVDDMSGTYANVPPYDTNTLSFTGSPMGGYTPTSANDINFPSTFDGMMNYYNGDLISHATGLYAGEMNFDQPYAEPPPAYSDIMGGQM